MSEVNQVLAHIKRSYPKPDPDATWVKECMDVLRAGGDDTSPAAMLEQYIHSDLTISARPSLPGNISLLHGQILFPQPTLLQITSVNDIGTSAVALQNTLEQRKDVFEGKTRIRGMDEGEDEEVIVPGKVPDYPRAMLKLELSDGADSVKAIEFKRIGGLRLGETPLGSKLQLHNVKITKGILMLTPENTKYIGGYVDQLEMDQPSIFMATLAQRLELAKDHAIGSGSPKARKSRGAASTSSSAKHKSTKAAPKSTLVKRELTIPAARLKYVPPPEYDAGPSRPTTTATGKRGRQSLPISIADSSDDDAEEAQAAARRRRAEAILAAANSANAHPPSDDFGLDDADESFLMHVEAVEAAATQRQKKSPYFAKTTRGPASVKPVTLPRRDGGTYNAQWDDGNDADEADEYDFDDDSFFNQIDEDQVVAVARSSGRGVGSGSRGSKGMTQSSEVIVISD